MTVQSYADFLAGKRRHDPMTGIADPGALPDFFKPHQDAITRWALKRGRAAVFAGTGLGKTLIELAWGYGSSRPGSRATCSAVAWASGRIMLSSSSSRQRAPSNTCQPIWATEIATWRDRADEQHIAPLQLDVIARCIDLWSNPGDIVLTPFLGIGSEVWGAVAAGRRGIGFELKPSYFAQARANLEALRREQCEGLLLAGEGTP